MIGNIDLRKSVSVSRPSFCASQIVAYCSVPLFVLYQNIAAVAIYQVIDRLLLFIHKCISIGVLIREYRIRIPIHLLSQLYFSAFWSLGGEDISSR